MTDTAAFAGLAVGFVLPIVFVLTTGNLQAATVVGFVPTVLTVGILSILPQLFVVIGPLPLFPRRF